MKCVNILFLTFFAVCVVAEKKNLLLHKNDKIGVESRISGGEDAKPGQFPYQVALKTAIDDSWLNSFFCGGSIISNRFILTAAHCTQEELGKPRNIIAVVGILNRYESGVTHKLSEIINHPRYDEDLIINDISLLYTTDEIIFTNLIKPIALPTHNSYEDFVPVYISGFGLTSSSSSATLANTLQFATGWTIPNDDCTRIYENHVRDTNICSMSPNTMGVCQGDSGGPLIDSEENILIGIVSFGMPCGEGYPDVYTRVYKYLDWINDEMDKQQSFFIRYKVVLLVCAGLVIIGAVGIAAFCLIKKKKQTKPVETIYATTSPPAITVTVPKSVNSST